MTNNIIKYLAAVFFVIAIVVHIHGIIYHPTTESNVSHIAHLIAYGACLAIVLLNPNKAALFYIIAAIYPLYYHSRCAFDANGNINGICLFVCVFMVFVAWWVVYTSHKQ